MTKEKIKETVDLLTHIKENVLMNKPDVVGRIDWVIKALSLELLEKPSEPDPVMIPVEAPIEKPAGDVEEHEDHKRIFKKRKH